MDPQLQLVLMIESGLISILGGAISAIVVSILTRRKNEAETKKLQAETEKLLQEMNNARNAPRKEALKILREKMIMAISGIKSLVPAYVVHTDLNLLPPEALNEFLSGVTFSDYEKQALITAKDKNFFYRQVLSQHNWQYAESAVRDFHNYFVMNSYLINENIIPLCKELDTLLNMSIEGTKLQQAAGVDVKLAEINDLFQKMLPIQEKLESLIKKELNSI